jgi:sialidase-1
MSMRYLLLTFLALPVAAAEPMLEKQSLFEADTCGYASYRIPGLVVTDKGTLLAYCEARKNSASDWGAIDLFYRRSTDGGKSWSEAKKIVDIGGGFEKNPVAVNLKLGKFPDITVNNPVAIVDAGAVHFLYCVEYMRCFYTRSEDDGQTFAPPVEITPTFEAFRPVYDWKVIATGPGHGIRLGKTGRLVVPVWLSTSEGKQSHRPSAVATIFSDDGGKTWSPGEIVAKTPLLTNPSEAAAVELPDDKVMLNIRHESTPHQRAVSVSPDGVTKWSKPTFDAALPEPICMGSLIRWGDRILFSNPRNSDSRDRKNVSVHASDDGGKTWKYRRSIESGPSGYSDLAVGKDGWAYCLYEDGTADRKRFQVTTLKLAKFNEAWLSEEKRPTDR